MGVVTSGHEAENHVSLPFGKTYSITILNTCVFPLLESFVFHKPFVAKKRTTKHCLLFCILGRSIEVTLLMVYII